MNIEADRLAKYFPGRKIHAGAKNHPHKAIYGAIQPITMEYHNITYTITSNLAKTIKNMISNYRRLNYWSSHNRDISNVLKDMFIFKHTAKNLPVWQRRWLSK